MKVFPFVLGVILILGIIIPTKVIAQDEHNRINRDSSFLGNLLKIWKEDLEQAKVVMANLTNLEWKPWRKIFVKII